jgi:hypothetical protein
MLDEPGSKVDLPEDGAVFRLARTHSLSVYDISYLDGAQGGDTTRNLGWRMESRSARRAGSKTHGPARR